MTNRKPTHPGAVLLEDVIKPLGLTITEAAKMLGYKGKFISCHLGGGASVTAIENGCQNDWGQSKDIVRVCK